MKPKIIIDTNILVSALRSSRGASNKLLSLLGTKKFITSVSVALVLEYEEVLYKHFSNLDKKDIDNFVDYMCHISEHQEIHYLWRPILRDPGDDMVLEVAVNAKADFIITYNKKDFGGAKKFDIKILTAKEFLLQIGVFK
ncbi:MAG: putative toxin-antitoxin system toxin component, PIN family [Thiotrichales bacterium]|nr:MAG: putative toxin-antitoxin system toxin component, PIN family [Thiotrichales bacterium]